MRIAILILCSLPISAAADTVTITVEVPDNLADVHEAMPTLGVHNDSVHSIEFYAFHGVPFTRIEKPGSGEAAPEAGRSGTGYQLRRMAPGSYESFPLWSRLDHGPGSSGTYRFALPYSIRRAKGRKIAKEAFSADVTIHYGDMAPAGYQATRVFPLPVLLGQAYSEVGQAPSHSAAALAKHFLPGIQACAKKARKGLPWLRGRFSLVAYRYPTNSAPLTFLDTSLLGDAGIHQCLAALPAPAHLMGKYELSFALPYPL